MPTLTVVQPPNNLVVKLNQPFLVTGRASDVGPPEPNLIDSVTVQVDGGPPVRATLTRIPDKKHSVVSFKASVHVAGGQDPHTVSITATNDVGRSVKQTVAVFTNVAFEVDSPAIIIDISPYPIDLTVPKEKKKLDSMLSQIQQQLVPLSASLASIGKVSGQARIARAGARGHRDCSLPKRGKSSRMVDRCHARGAGPVVRARSGLVCRRPGRGPSHGERVRAPTAVGSTLVVPSNPAASRRTFPCRLA
jgi:hypothetical protein